MTLDEIDDKIHIQKSKIVTQIEILEAQISQLSQLKKQLSDINNRIVECLNKPSSPKLEQV